MLSDRARQYKHNSFYLLTHQDAPRELSGGLRMTIEACPPDFRIRDLDNILKPIFDVLDEYGMFEKDDSQIDDLRIYRQRKGNKVIITVEEIDNDWRRYKRG